ncbi:MAG TPA: recombination regulator RecX [Gallionella sp.]|nr:recombination regulator RecX [Gallionella sp.]
MRKKPETSLRTRALQYLARREYSRAELRAKLLPHLQRDEEFDGVSFDHAPGEDLDALLDDLTQRGWLSDERAATQLLHAKRGRYGTQRITHELRQRGIGETLIAEALPELKESELATAREVWRKKFGVLPQDAKEKARQMRFLQSRGFGFEVVARVLRLGPDGD